MSAITISVLLATFNGVPYLRRQLESLAYQTSLPTELIVGDDGSFDATRSIIEEFAETSPFIVRWVPPHNERLGPRKNFARLLGYASGDYIFFCDQDDVWLPDKITLSLKEMQRLEGLYGLDTPCLVHTDLSVVDSSDTIIAPSFWRYQHLEPSLSLKLNAALAQNVATGCTMSVNRAAVNAIVPVPLTGPLMHDWWFLVVTLAIGGKVSYIDCPTALYRQHGANAVGAKGWGLPGILKKMWSGEQNRTQLRATQMQASALLKRHGDQLQSIHQKLVEDYAALPSLGFFAKRICIWRHNICKSSWQRTLGLYLYV